MHSFALDYNYYVGLSLFHVANKVKSVAERYLFDQHFNYPQIIPVINYVVQVQKQEAQGKHQHSNED
jgi:hypothetical protein